MQKQKEILVRLDRCMGCHSCELACAVEHSAGKSLFTAIAEKSAPRKRLYVEHAGGQAVPLICRHCEDAPCMHACICGAISRTENGDVLTDKDKCIGCWTCVMVCPYGVIGRHVEEHKAYRCDRCPNRHVPACVEACATKALVYQTVESYTKDVRKTASREMVSGVGG